MKIIYLLILSLFISFNANAVDIYKCEIDKRTEIASCGFYNTCINIITNEEYTKPFVHSYDLESSYTVLAFKDKLIVKRDYDKHEFVFEKRINSSYFYVGKDSIQVYSLDYGSFNLIEKHFYHELSSRNSRIFHTGTCKKE